MAAARAPKRTFEEVLTEMVPKIIDKSTAGANQAIALGIQQSSEQSKESMARERDLSARLKESQDEVQRLHKELCIERAANQANTLEIRKADNNLEAKKIERENAKDAFNLGKDFLEKAERGLQLKALAAVSPNGAGKAATPSIEESGKPTTEALIHALICDLSPGTVALLYGGARHLLLPLLAKQDFLIPAYAATIGQMGEELQGALVRDLGQEASNRIMAVARSAGYGQ